MKNMTLENIAKAVCGALHTERMPASVCAQTTEAAGVVIDSRKAGKDFVFVATRGERVDGHCFIDQVFDAGALGVICEREPENPRGAYILVEDSFQALKDVAAYYRSQLDIRVVGITGSVGKTSTKEFVASVLSKEFCVLKTAGNFNNEVGLPLTVLQIREDCEIAVLEMGISDFGEMHRLSRIARPDLCLITNIGQCHLENLGTRDGILKAKTEIFDFMREDGQVCLNGDDDKLGTIRSVRGSTPVFFGVGKNNAIYADCYENRGLAGGRARIHIKKEAAKEGVEADFEVEIPLPGEHMLYNALAATAVGTLFGLSTAQIQAGVRDVEAVGGRSHVIRTDRLTLIDDCYNANPVSMKAAIDLLHMTDAAEFVDADRNASRLGVRKAAILGDMFELGTDETALHRAVGVYAAEKQIDVIVCVGKLSKYMYEGAESAADTAAEVYYFADKETLFAELEKIIHDGDIVLVKASHGMHFEDIIAKLS
ncbi:MAG: UDP-N-acetylmuramoyl-tripeptide--D-alanyl-D-alanine ligase [Lachnospiraceae bacterium]|nr:UDP-N-acetylmuramoyl-tripeptide--D-alanyl-D-alanine ligase [Lachnospiraceae bacterium]